MPTYAQYYIMATVYIVLHHAKLRTQPESEALATLPLRQAPFHAWCALYPCLFARPAHQISPAKGGMPTGLLRDE